jgi:hypothetical protein
VRQARALSFEPGRSLAENEAQEELSIPVACLNHYAFPVSGSFVDFFLGSRRDDDDAYSSRWLMEVVPLPSSSSRVPALAAIGLRPRPSAFSKERPKITKRRPTTRRAVVIRVRAKARHGIARVLSLDQTVQGIISRIAQCCPMPRKAIV